MAFFREPYDPAVELANRAQRLKEQVIRARAAQDQLTEITAMIELKRILKELDK